jgi:thioredoxin-related protein
MSLLSRTLALIVGLVLVIGLASCVSAAPAPAAELWTDNFEQAKAQAKKEGKDLLVDFTGTDWCPWCVKLRQEVFDKEKFKAEAPKKFVLVEIDFPRTKKLADAVKKQNAALQQQYSVEGFPTILLMDADGKVYGKTGYQPGGEEKYLKHLDELQQVRVERDKLAAEAEKMTGLEKAKALDKLIMMLGKNGIEPMDNPKWIDEIIKLDPKNEAGLKTKYESMLKLSEALKLAEGGQLDAAVKAIDKTLADLKLTGQEAQNALFLKALCLLQKNDKVPAKATLQAALEAAPQGERAKVITQALQSLDKQK